MKWQDDPVLLWMFLIAQGITALGFIWFFWFVWACERDLKKLREDYRKGRELNEPPKKHEWSVCPVCATKICGVCPRCGGMHK